MHILVACSDDLLAQAIEKPFRHKGHAVDVVRTWDDADTVLRTVCCDLVILDLALAGDSGIRLIALTRLLAPRVPVLVLTAAGDLKERVAALHAGADDCLGRSFAIRELEARAAALIRRGTGGGSATLKLGRVTLDTATRIARIGANQIDLANREFCLLESLLLSAGQVVEKRSLYEGMFNSESEAGPNALELYVHRVRKKLEGSTVQIRTVRGVGYCIELAPPPTRAKSAGPRAAV